LDILGEVAMLEFL